MLFGVFVACGTTHFMTLWVSHLLAALDSLKLSLLLFQCTQLLMLVSWFPKHLPKSGSSGEVATNQLKSRSDREMSGEAQL